MKFISCCSVADTIVSQSMRRGRRRGKKFNTEFKVPGKQFAHHFSLWLKGALYVGISIWKVSESAIFSLAQFQRCLLAPIIMSLRFPGSDEGNDGEVDESEYHFWLAFAQNKNGRRCICYF